MNGLFLSLSAPNYNANFTPGLEMRIRVIALYMCHSVGFRVPNFHIHASLLLLLLPTHTFIPQGKEMWKKCCLQIGSCQCKKNTQKQYVHFLYIYIYFKKSCKNKNILKCHID